MAETKTENTVALEEAGHNIALIRPVYASGVILQIKHDTAEVYEVEQVEEEDFPESGRSLLAPGDIPFDWSLGPVRIVGYINTITLTLSVSVYIAGIKLGEFKGDLKKGIEININLLIAQGVIKFFTKNGKDLWVSFSITGIVNVSGEHKIFGW